MIFPYQEGKALHDLKELLENRKTYAEIKVNLGEKEQACSIALPFNVKDVLTSFRYQQSKLKDGKLQPYPPQLISLARYYRYSCGENDSREKTIEKMREWLDTICRVLIEEEETNAKANDMTDGFLTKAFPVPLFDNDIPLEAVVSEAEFAGSMEEHFTYPSCNGLIVYDEENNAYSISKESDREQFWKVQLWALAHCEKKVHSTKGLERYVKSRRTQAMFALGVWYANQLSVIQNNPKVIQESSSKEQPAPVLENDQTEEEIQQAEDDCVLQFIRYNTNRWKNTFMEFSTDGNLSQAMVVYYRFLRQFWTADKSTIAFIYRNPDTLDETSKEEVNKLSLPDPCLLDPGVRICDAGLPFYGISFRVMKLIFSGIKQLKIEEYNLNASGKGKKQFGYRGYFGITPDFSLTSTEKLPDGYDQEKWKKMILKRYYDSYCKVNGKFEEIKEKIEEDESLHGAVQRCLEAYYSIEKYDGELGDAAEKRIKTVFDQMKTSISETIKKHAESIIQKIRNGETPNEEEMKMLDKKMQMDTLTDTLTAHQERTWEQIKQLYAQINSEKNNEKLRKELRKQWYSLFLSLWKKNCSDPEDIIKPWLTALPESLSMEIMIGDHPYETLAAILVRSRTMLILYYRQWIRSGLPTDCSVEWYSAEHLLIPLDLRKEEKTIIEKKFRSNSNQR